MWRMTAVVMLLAVAGCETADPVPLEPEEIDVCPEVAEQMEDHLTAVVEFLEGAALDELESAEAAALAERGIELSQRAGDLGCAPDEVKALIEIDRLESDHPIAQEYIEAVLDALG